MPVQAAERLSGSHVIQTRAVLHFQHHHTEHRSTPEWGQIARDLKARYGETLTPDEVRQEMDAPKP